MSRILCILLVMLLLPVSSLAEPEIHVTKNYITFPGLDEMKGYFRCSSKWTIVHRDNLDEHMAFLVDRSEAEDDIRARFAEDTLLWERS